MHLLILQSSVETQVVSQLKMTITFVERFSNTAKLSNVQKNTSYLYNFYQLYGVTVNKNTTTIFAAIHLREAIDKVIEQNKVTYMRYELKMKVYKNIYNKEKVIN